MVGKKPCIFWQISWMFISPVIVLVILIFYLVTQAQKELTYLVWDPNSVSTQMLCFFLLMHDCKVIMYQCMVNVVDTTAYSGNKSYVLWFTGVVPDYGISTISVMDQRCHLSFGRDPQSGSASVCIM